MTAAKVKTAKTKNAQPGPFEGWTIEEMVAEMGRLVGELCDAIAEKEAS
ncbi:MAG TPA: hypothetical protein VHU85_17880 [Acidimicrobiales bacterium]|jgi:hypothetical protein|nr:hypothetical protein [Acidimicrobiales bacterium]